MSKFTDFLLDNGNTLAGYISGMITGLFAWFSERRKRIQDKRDSDVLFWEKTIDRQNVEISRLEERIRLIEQRYEEQIQRLLARIAELEEKQSHSESRNTL